MTSPTPFVDQKTELSSLIQAGLGHPVDDEALSALAKMQDRLQSRVARLGEMLSVHEISRTRYIQEMETAFKEASKFGQRILGEKGFHAVFGEMTANNLFDVEQFFREEG